MQTHGMHGTLVAPKRGAAATTLHDGERVILSPPCGAPPSPRFRCRGYCLLVRLCACRRHDMLRCMLQ